MQSVCVFCGSSSGFDPAYVDTANALGRLLAAEGLTLVSVDRQFAAYDVALLGG